MIDLYHHFQNSSNENVLKSLLGDLARHYDKLTMAVSTMKQTQDSVGSMDPVAVWNQLQEVVAHSIDIISSDKNETMRSLALKCAESVLVFGLAAESVSLDPRRKAVVQRSSSSGSSSAEIPLHHPFIERQKIEDEAAELFSKLELWAIRGGPQQFPFTAAHMAQLAQIIIKCCENRSTLKSKAVKAVTVIINGKKNKSAQMTTIQRMGLVKMVNAFAKGCGASEGEAAMTKLRQALTFLEGLKEATVEEREEEDEELGKEEDTDDINRAGVSVRDMPLLKRMKKDDGAVAATSGGAGAKSSATAILDPRRKAKQDLVSSSSAAEVVIPKNEVVLSTELGFFQDFPSAQKLIGISAIETAATTAAVSSIDPRRKSKEKVQASKSVVAARSVKTMKADDNHFDANTSTDLTMLNVSKETYSEIAMASLKRLLDSIKIMQSLGKAMVIAHLKSVLRTTLVMSNVELQDDKQLEIIEIIVNTPSGPDFDLSLLDTISRTVTLPRPLWLYISFALGCEPSTDRSLGDFADPRQYLLRELMLELYRRGGCSPLYENVCMVLISRLIQRKTLRVLANSIIPLLPEVPVRVLSLLKLVADLGSRATVGKAQAGVKVVEEKDKGTRLVSISYMQLVVTGRDYNAADDALNQLLWCSVSEDFEVRSKVVVMITQEILPVVGELVDKVLHFALQAALAVSGLVEIRNSGSSGSMEIDEGGQGGGGSGEEEAKEEYMTVKSTLLSYDEGLSFGGKKFAIDVNKFTESIVNRHVHLIFYCTLEHPSLLGFIVDMLDVIECEREAIDAKKAATEGSVNSLLSSVVTGPETHLDLVSKVLESEFDVYVPAVSQRWPPLEIFTHIKHTSLRVRSLMIKALGLIQADISIVTSEELVSAVRDFIAQDREQFIAHMAGKGHFPQGDMKLLAPVISGVKPEDLQESLTLVIAAHLESDYKVDKDVTAVKKVFKRLLHARPPIMTKTALLLFLHNKHEEYCRVDGNEGRLKQQSMIDCIEYCITSKEDNWGDSIQQALTSMLDEAGSVPLPSAIMRTAIIGCQAYPDKKRFVLTTLLPKIMKLRVWSNLKIWAGVAHGVNILTNHKDKEPTLRSVLGVPGSQMSFILEKATNIKESMKKLIKSFSLEEYNEVLSGKWLFGDEDSSTNLPIGEDGKVILDDEKAAIVRSILED